VKTNTKTVLETTMGGTTQVFSPPINLDQVYAFAFHYFGSVSPTGSLVLQATCQEGKDEQGKDLTQWVTIDSAITLSANGIVNKDGVGYRWIRFAYTPASGSGILSVLLCTKG
jgi:hypothetical protein